MTELPTQAEKLKENNVELLSERDQSFAHATIERLNSPDDDTAVRVIYGELGNGKTTLLNTIEAGLDGTKLVNRVDWPSFEPYAQFIANLQPEHIVLVDDIDRLSWSTSEKVGFLELIRANDQGIRAVITSELTPEYKPKATFGEKAEEPTTENVELYDVVTFTNTEVSKLIDQEVGEQHEAVKQFVLEYQDVFTGFRRREWMVLVNAIKETRSVPESVDDVLELMDDYYAHHTLERVKALSPHGQKVISHVLFRTATSRATNVSTIAQDIGASHSSVAAELGTQLKKKSSLITQAPVTALYQGDTADQKIDMRQSAYAAQDPLFAIWVARRTFKDRS